MDAVLQYVVILLCYSVTLLSFQLRFTQVYSTCCITEAVTCEQHVSVVSQALSSSRLCSLNILYNVNIFWCYHMKLTSNVFTVDELCYFLWATFDYIYFHGVQQMSRESLFAGQSFLPECSSYSRSETIQYMWTLNGDSRLTPAFEQNLFPLC